MNIDSWALLWKIVFITAVGLFALMTIWVTIGGWFDVKDLFRTLGRRSNPDKDKPSSKDLSD